MSGSRPAKNWDKIVADFEEEERKEGNSNERDFFRQLYEQADDDARRAMVKSMQESHGTKLIMNWDEVKQGQCKPYESEEELDKATQRAMERDMEKDHKSKGVTYTKADLDRLKAMNRQSTSDDDSDE